MKLSATITSFLLIGSQLSQETTGQELKVGPRNHKKLYINKNGEASTEPSISKLRNAVVDELTQYGFNSIKQFENSSLFVKQSQNHLRQIIYKISNNNLMIGSVNEKLDIKAPPELNKETIYNTIGKVYEDDQLETVRVGTQELAEAVEKSFEKLQRDIEPFMKKIKEKWTTEYIKKTYNLDNITELSNELYLDENMFGFKFKGQNKKVHQLTKNLNNLLDDYMANVAEINEAFQRESDTLTKESIAFFQNELGLPVAL